MYGEPPIRVHVRHRPIGEPNTLARRTPPADGGGPPAQATDPAMSSCASSDTSTQGSRSMRDPCTQRAAALLVRGLGHLCGAEG